MVERSNRLQLTRTQILAFRRSVQALDTRLPHEPSALRHAAWAGLQDSMPRAASLSIHARVEGTTSTTWEAPSLVQLWGPRYSAYIVDAGDAPAFTLGRLPDAGSTRRVAEALADRLARTLGDDRVAHDAAGRALGEPPNRLRYATLTGRVRMRWDGARQPKIWMVPPPVIGAGEARRELARRYVHFFGPATPEAFAAWAGIAPRSGTAAFDELGASLVAVRTPSGDGSILASDEPLFRRRPGAVAPARLLPSGDAYFLFQRPEERALLVENAAHRGGLWTSRVWPGALLVRGRDRRHVASIGKDRVRAALAAPLPIGTSGGRRRGGNAASSRHPLRSVDELGRMSGDREALHLPRIPHEKRQERAPMIPATILGLGIRKNGTTVPLRRGHSADEKEQMMPNSVQFHRVLRATPDRVYRAFLDPEATVKWLPPHGFTGKVHHMDARVGGSYKMSFTNFTSGKSHSFGGEYRELVPPELLRWTDRFDDPNLPGEMTVTVRLKAVSVGTEVHIVQDGIPDVIPAEACVLGWQESLTLLAQLVEAAVPG